MHKTYGMMWEWYSNMDKNKAVYHSVHVTINNSLQRHRL